MHLNIRHANPEDGAAIAGIYEPFVTNTPITFEETSPTPDEMSERVRQTLLTWPFLVAEDDGHVIGYAYAASHGVRRSYRWSVNVSVYLAATHHRRGIGRKLYEQLFLLLVRQGFAMAYAGVTLPNAASVGLHESLGFKQIARYHDVGYKLGAWRDVGWWERPLVLPLPANPAEPIPWAAMSQLK